MAAHPGELVPTAERPVRRAVHVAALLLILAVALVLRGHFFIGLVGADVLDTWYRACLFSRGDLSPVENPINGLVALRYGLALPAAICFALGGVNEHSAAVFPMLASLAAIAATWDVTRRLTGSFSAGHIAAALLCLNGLEIEHSSSLLASGPLASLTILSLWLLILGFQVGAQKWRLRALLWCAAGLVAGYAFSVKITAALIPISVGVWVLLALKRRDVWVCLAWVALGTGVALLFELSLHWIVNGHPLYRLLAIPDLVRSTTDSIKVAKPHLAPQTFDPLRSLARYLESAPNASVVILLALLASVYLIIARRRDLLVRLLVVFFLVHTCSKALELSVSLAAQPRRFLPPIVLGTALIPTALWSLGNTRAACWGRGFTTVILAGLTLGLLWRVESPALARKQTRLASERALWSWIQDHAAEVATLGLYADHRTLGVLSALSGFDDAELNMHTYPAYWRDEAGAVVEPRPPRYAITRAQQESSGPWTDLGFVQDGFWVTNPHYTRWIARNRILWFNDYLDQPLPPQWELAFVTGGYADELAGVFRVHPTGSPSQRRPLDRLTLRTGDSDEQHAPLASRSRERTARVFVPALSTAESTTLRSERAPWTQVDVGFDTDGLFELDINNAGGRPVWMRLTVRSWTPGGERAAEYGSSHLARPGETLVGLLVKRPLGPQHIEAEVLVRHPGSLQLGPLTVRPAVD
jgi:hypothetical protein